MRRFIFSKKMKICIKTLKGTYFMIEVKPEHKVADVKKIIESEQGSYLYPAAHQMLIHQGKVLKDDTTLEENKVNENSVLVVMLARSRVASNGASSTSAAPEPPYWDQNPFLASPPPIVPPPQYAPATPVPPLGRDTSYLFAGYNLEASIQQIIYMGGGFWNRESVIRALRAANNNPERAIDYLYDGIPELAPNSPVFYSGQARTPLDIFLQDPFLAAPPPIVSPPQYAPAAPVPPPSQDTSYLFAGFNLEASIQQILYKGGGFWNRESVIRALRAANNNPERAIEYLYNGIPEPAPISLNFYGGQARNPPDIFPQGFPDMRSNAGAGTLDFLRNSQQFQALRDVVQDNPQVLQPMRQKLGKQNPDLMQLNQEHQADFLRLINEPNRGREGNVFGQSASAMPPAVIVTSQQRGAIERLEAMGFDRALVLEVYFTCNKDEERAANFLLDHMHEFED